MRCQRLARAVRILIVGAIAATAFVHGAGSAQAFDPYPVCPQDYPSAYTTDVDYMRHDSGPTLNADLGDNHWFSNSPRDNAIVCWVHKNGQRQAWFHGMLYWDPEGTHHVGSAVLAISFSSDGQTYGTK